MTSDLTEKSLERIWTYNIFPLLEEQLWGDQEQIKQWRWPQVKTRFAAELAGKAAAATIEPKRFPGWCALVIVRVGCTPTRKPSATTRQR